MANEVDTFLDQVNNTEQETNPFEPQEQKEPVIEKEEEKLPFHQDPKVQRYLQKELDARLLERSTQIREEILREIKSATPSKDASPLRTAWERAVGNDTVEKQLLVDTIENQFDALRAENQKLKQDMLAEKQEEQAAEAELRDGLSTIEDTFNVDLSSNIPQARKLRGDFLEFVEAIAPKKNGVITDYPDFEQSFKLFQTLNDKQTSTAKAKDLASRSMARSSDAQQLPTLDRYDWDAIERHFSSLGN